MVLGIIYKSWRLKGKLLRRVAFVAFLDFLANVLVMIGLLFVGAGVYAVLFSSWCSLRGLIFDSERQALLPEAVVRRRAGNVRHGPQWFSKVEDALDAGHGALGRFELGAGVILGGTALHSLSLVCAESVSAGEAVSLPFALRPMWEVWKRACTPSAQRRAAPSERSRQAVPETHPQAPGRSDDRFHRIHSVVVSRIYVTHWRTTRCWRGPARSQLDLLI